MTTTHPYEALIRHFGDLRDGTHGTAHTRAGKEELFTTAVDLLDSAAHTVLADANHLLLLDTGTITATGVERDHQGLQAQWTLTWPEQTDAGLPPLALIAHYGHTFHHPHLRGTTIGEWPLNIFTADDATEQIPTLRAIVISDLHNLVYQRDYRIVPAITSNCQ
jgi:hypothetical protein